MWIEHLDKSDPCWELFSYNSILNEPRYLSRALKCLKSGAAREVSEEEMADLFKELYSSLRTVDGDVTKASEIVKGTIDMVSTLDSIKDLISRFTITYRSRKPGVPAAQTTTWNIWRYWLLFFCR